MFGGYKSGTVYSDPPLTGALRNGELDLAKLLIRHGADLNLRSADRASSLHAACEGDCVVSFGNLLTSQIGCVTSSGETPMHRACAHGSASSLQWLLENDGSMQRVDRRYDTPLHTAC